MKIFEWFFAFFPTRLPIGVTAHERWAASVVRLAGVPDNRSTRFALAMVLQGGKTARVSKRFMADQLRKLCANEVAQHVTQELKAAQKAEWEAERKAAGQTNPEPGPVSPGDIPVLPPAEVTPESPGVTNDESTKPS